jgi:ABC-type antimicrobial peptide transport system permease subunit
MAKKTKDKRLILIILAIVIILALVNAVLFLNKPSPVYCYKDVCIRGEEDPLAEITSLINGSSKAIIVIEEDQEASQKNEFLTAVFVALGKDFGNKKEQIVGIAMKDGAPLRCICTTNFNGENFTDCQDNSTSYCESIVPGQDEIMLKVYYPAFNNNEIIIENRTVKFQTKSGQDALAVVNFFGDFFIRKVIR